jgi:hypothetical protein
MAFCHHKRSSGLIAAWGHYFIGQIKMPLVGRYFQLLFVQRLTEGAVIRAAQLVIPELSRRLFVDSGTTSHLFDLVALVVHLARIDDAGSLRKLIHQLLCQFRVTNALQIMNGGSCLAIVLALNHLVHVAIVVLYLLLAMLVFLDLCDLVLPLHEF